MELNGQIKTLVLSGGSVRCIAFVGAIKELEEAGVYDYSQMETFVGASGGSIVSVLLSIGYTADELTEYLNGVDFSKIQSFSVRKVFSLYGLDSGHGIIKILEDMLEKKGFSRSITLKKLFQMTGKTNYIATTCVNRSKSVYLTHESHPDISVVHAIRMSISIPFIFTAVKYGGDFFVDGGLLDHYPITIFDPNDDGLLGLNLDEYPDDADINVEINGIQDYVVALMSCINRELQTIKRQKYARQTIAVHTEGITGLDFKLTPEKIQMLIGFGRDSVAKFTGKPTIAALEARENECEA